ncbi:MAG: GNAT family N-acetyltransferase [Magnetococcales bacterium]|nr:GNAT family N-acetyltransferase [Magnetococcales bacterium]
MSLTLAPLPEWRNLLELFSRKEISDAELAEPWCREGDRAFWFSRSTWSLAVVTAWREQWTGREVVVWVPDYFCNAALYPLRAMNTRLVFYPIDATLKPDLVACQRLAERFPPDLFVLVHYFGEPNDAPWLGAFCQDHGAWLIEDGAHVLQPIPGVGVSGDVVLYSPHKLLAIPDGAVMIVTASGPAQLTARNKAMELLTTIQAGFWNRPGERWKQPLIWMLKRFLQRLGIRRGHHTAFAQPAGESMSSRLLHPRMTDLSRRLLRGQSSRIPWVAQQRRHHQERWARLLAWALPLPVDPMASSGHGVPYLARYGLGSARQAEETFDRLQKLHFPVTTWPDLPPEVLSDSDDDSNAQSWRNTSLFLAVHQSLSNDGFGGYGRRLLKCMTSGWQVREVLQPEWEQHWANGMQTSLLQAWEYGEAKARAEGWRVCRLLVVNDSGTPTGLAQLLIRPIWGVGGIARLNRGPILMRRQADANPAAKRLAVLWVLMREARQRHWWVLLAAPELPDDPMMREGLRACGFRMRNVPGWASGRLSLRMEEQGLLMNLDGKWRCSLRKGMKLGVLVSRRSATGDDLEALLQNYRRLQQNRAFVGLSEALLRMLARESASANWKFNLFFAHASESGMSSPIGMLVSIRAGDTATYLIGTSDDEGRRMQANSVMLWEAIRQAKDDGCAWFDVGGLNAETPKGIAEFKRGINATPYQFVGEWYRIG